MYDDYAELHPLPVRGVSGIGREQRGQNNKIFYTAIMNIKKALLRTGYIIRWETDVWTFACAPRT